MEVDFVATESLSTGHAEQIITPPPPIELDPWSGFDEFQDLDRPLSIDEMKEKLDEMIGPDQEATLWDARQFVSFELHPNSWSRAFREQYSDRAGSRQCARIQAQNDSPYATNGV
jgi:hypothetical protein